MNIDARPLVIAHRGASGERPEHTLAAYRLGIEQGADFIEPDLVSTRDGVLIARHENELSGTTDVADHPEFAQRRTSKRIDGDLRSGWFSEDFSWAEIQTLRARERIPAIRPGNARYDGIERIPSLQQILELVRAAETEGRVVGIYPETKHPTWFASEGRQLDDRPIDRNLGRMLVAQLVAAGFTDPSRVFIQSFELGNLLELANTIMPAYAVALPLVLLIGELTPSRACSSAHRPHDLVAAASVAQHRNRIGYPGLQDALECPLDELGYSDLVAPAGLHWLRQQGISAIGPWKDSLLPRQPGGGTPDGRSGLRISGRLHPMLADARAAGLAVHPYTLRADAAFLAFDETGNELSMEAEARRLLDGGATGFFTDFPQRGVALRDHWWAGRVRREVGS